MNSVRPFDEPEKGRLQQGHGIQHGCLSLCGTTGLLISWCAVPEATGQPAAMDHEPSPWDGLQNPPLPCLPKRKFQANSSQDTAGR